jgi:outer membrane biosynthesis protein TonB
MRYQASLGKAILLHCLVLLLAFLAPHVFQHRFTLPDIQTVTLYSVSELAEKAPARQEVKEQQKAEQQSKPEPVQPDQPVVSLNTKPLPEPPPTVADTPAKVISLKPIKRKKIVNKPVTRPPAPSKAQLFRKQQAARQLLAAQKEAELARKQALDRIRQNLKSRSIPATTTTTPSIRATTAPATTVPAQSAPAGAQGTVEVEEYIGQYVFEVRQLIRQYWQLPDLRNWDPTLEGIIVVKVRKNGEIIKSYFEKRSTNKFYNQSLEKALKSAGKLPPLPAELKADTYEFGLRFRLSDML